MLKVEKGAICRLISETRRRINELGAGKVAAIILACQKTTGIAEAIKQSNTNSQKQIKQMKKQISKISLKTDKIVTLSKNDAQSIVGAKPVKTLSCQVGRCWPNG